MFSEVLADAFDYRGSSILHQKSLMCRISPTTNLRVCNHGGVLLRAGFFSAALMDDKALQIPMHRAHVNGALTGEGEVHVAEVPGEGVVGVAVWCVARCGLRLTVARI